VQQQQAQLDQRAAHLTRLMEQAPEALRRELSDKVELSWIYHESALEGVVYSPDELALALRGGTPSDPVMVSSFDEIRQNKATIDMVRGWAADKQSKIDADVVKDIYAALAPDEVDGKKPPAYRKDIPLHRLYFHEIAAPDKIIPKLKAFGQWINAPDTRRTTHALRLAAKAHFHLLHIYPSPKPRGSVERRGMNWLLPSAASPPALIHATERQRYYDALKTNENALAQIVKEALTASIESSIRFLEGRLPPPAPPPVKKVRAAPRRSRASEPPPAAKTTSATPRAATAPLAVRPQAASTPPARALARPEVPSSEAKRATGPATAKPTTAKAAPAKPESVNPTQATPAKAADGRPTPAKASRAAAPVRAAKPARAAKAAPRKATSGAVKVVKVKAKAVKVARTKPKARRAA